MPALFKKIQKGEFEYPNWFTEEVKDLLDKIIEVDPKKRWSIKQIAQHSWWKKGGPYRDFGESQPAEQIEESNDPTSIDLEGKENMDQQPMAMDETPKGGNEVKIDEMEKTNAFEIIDMVTGGPLGSLVHSERKKFLYLSRLPPEEIMKILEKKLQSIPGHVSQQRYKNGFKLRAEFDMGRGRVKVKVNIKLAHEKPILCLVVVKRAGGDIISFQQVSRELDTIDEYLKVGEGTKGDGQMTH